MNFWRRRDQSLNEEIQDYLDRQTAENLAAGMPPTDARAAALRKLGNAGLVKENTRAAWGWMWLERLWQDVSHGARMFAKNPGFSAIAVLSIAIGTGANCAMFSAVDALLLRPLPVPRPSEVLSVRSRFNMGYFSHYHLSYRDYLDVRDRSRSFQGLAAYSPLVTAFVADPSATPGDAVPKVLIGALATGNFFQVLEVQPELGRTFRLEEDQVRSRDAVVVLGHNLWEREFASDPSVLGRRVRINGTEFTVIGVAPATFTGLDPFVRLEFFVPTMMWPQLNTDSAQNPLEDRNLHLMAVRGRLQPGVSLAEAGSEVGNIGRSLEQAYPESNRNVQMVVNTEFQTRIEEGPSLGVFSILATILAVAVLLVSCANLAGLLLSRTPVRAREIALRLAVGAPRTRLLRQLLTENLLLAAAGALLGLAVGAGIIRLLQQIQFPSDLPFNLHFSFDGRVLVFSLVVALSSVFIFGLIPAFETMRSDLAESIKNSGAAATDRRRLWGRNALVSAQVGVALVLLTIAVSVYHTFDQGYGSGPGYRTDHLLLMSFDPSLVHYGPEKISQFYENLSDGARKVPGVKSVALTTTVPMNLILHDTATIVPEGYRAPLGGDGEENIQTHWGARVDENYFSTMALAITRGRGFRRTDDAGAPLVAIVNRALADHYWPGEDPVGKRFRRDGHDGPWVEIVGVTPTTKYILPIESGTPYVYLPMRQNPGTRMTLIVESIGDPTVLAAPLREMVSRLDRTQPIYDVMTMEHFYDANAVRMGHVSTSLIGGMGLAGMLLSMVGLYGLVTYSANRRTREIGIRMAVGADPPAVLRMILRQGFWLATFGVALGLIASRVMDASLRAAFPWAIITDVSVHVVVVPILLLVTLVAAYIPARRASRVNPTVALRHE